VTDPRTFEASMSLLALAIGHIERNPPRNFDDVNRLRLLVSRIDTATTRANRAIELEKTHA
jgi:hypothetical protein